MQVDVRLTNQAFKSSDANFARAARMLCELAIFSNRLYIADCKAKGAPVLPLYSSGIHYENEPPGRPDELVDIPTILRRKWGDCMHLCCWRVAELREAGKPADIGLVWNRQPNGGRLFHVIVRLNDGALEDPSRKLGM